MRALAEAHPDHAFVQQAVARLPWGHVIRLLENVKDVTRREWYARQAIEHGWSRNVLVHQIESNLYERQGEALERLLSGVTKLTLEHANKLGKPVLHICSTRKEQILNQDSLRLEIQALTDFLCSNKIEVLNEFSGPSPF